MPEQRNYKAIDWERMLNMIDIGVHLIDREGVTIFYNEKMAEIDGLKREDVLGRKISQLYPSLTAETSTLAKALQTGKEQPEKLQTYVNVLGKRITTINRTYPLLEGNTIAGAMEVAKDITGIIHLHDQILDLRHQLYESQQLPKDKKSAGTAQYSFSDLIGRSSAFLDAVAVAKKSARTSSPVFICGATGTGKELIAQSIHNASARKGKPFIAQNCAAVPAELMEGIMFGTARGAFTGAIDRAGLFEQASGGTLFLDEINSLDLFLQAKLLRVLQDGMVRRIGGVSERHVDVRIIAAMNMEPTEALERGILRYDLFYRLNVVSVHLPPLAHRKDDITLLAHHFVDRFNPMFGMKITGFSDSAMNRLLAYHWPGNVRELSHAIESTYKMMELTSERIEEHHLPVFLRGESLQPPVRPRREEEAEASSPPAGSLAEMLRQLEREAIVDALERHRYNISLAARQLGMKRQALQYKMQRYGIEKPL